MLAGDINLNPGPITTIHNSNIWDDLTFCSCNLSFGWAEYQFNINSNNSISDDKRSVYNSRGMHFIQLSFNSLLRKCIIFQC